MKQFINVWKVNNLFAGYFVTIVLIKIKKYVVDKEKASKF